MADRAMRLSIALLSEALWVADVVDVDQCTAEAGMAMRREVVGKVLAAHGFAQEEVMITRVVEFLPDVAPFQPIPMIQFSELATLLSLNLLPAKQA